MYISKNPNGTIAVGNLAKAGSVSVTELPAPQEFLLWNDADPVNPIVDEAKIFNDKAIILRDTAQKLLDDTALSLEFDDMKSARASSGVPLVGDETVEELRQYNNAVALGQWHRKVWAYMALLKTNLLNTKEVTVDTVTTIEPDPIKTEIEWVDFMPTVDELLASLPVYVGVV